MTSCNNTGQDSLETFTKAIESLKEKMSKLRSKKLSSDTPQNFSLLPVIQLHKAFRKTMQDLSNNLSSVTSSKEDMERHALKLQNLLYEKNHVLKEIEGCQGFTTPALDLINFTDFKTSADASVHSAQLERLENEMTSRKQLQVELASVKTRMKNVEAETESKKEFLNGLPTYLRELEKASKPLQTYMSISASETLQLYTEAKTLPHPLYLLYCQLDAYPDNPDMKLTVVNSSYKNHGTTGSRKRSAETHSSERSSKRIKRSASGGGSSPASTSAVVKTAVVVARPSDKTLVVQFSDLKIYFEYYPDFGVVSVETPEMSGILTSLFPEDTGTVDPNLKNNYKENMKEFPESLRPYLWAQWICGCYHLCPTMQEAPEPSIRAVVTQIQKRIQAQKDLQTQLQKLESSLVLTIEGASGSNTKISSWKKCMTKPAVNVFGFPTSDNNEKVPVRNTCDGNPEGNAYYEVEFTNESKTVVGTAVVEISPEYPVRPPRFVFQDKTGKSFDGQLKDVEVELNAFAMELVPSEAQVNWILSYQLKKAQVCFDILSSTGPTAAAFGRHRRGKDRRRAIVVTPDSNQCKHR